MQRNKNVFLGIGVLVFGFCALMSMLFVSSTAYATDSTDKGKEQVVDQCVSDVEGGKAIDPFNCPYLSDVVDQVPSGSTLHLAPHQFEENGSLLESWNADLLILNKSLTLEAKVGIPGEIVLFGTIQAGGSSQVTITGGITVRNNLYGVVAGDSSQVIVAGGTTLSNNVLDGILALKSSTVTVTGATILGNGLFGIVAQDSSQVTVSGSTISNNGLGGIIALGSSTVVVKDSSIQGNGTNQWCQGSYNVCAGIQASDKTTLQLQGGVTLTGNTRWGIAVEKRKCGFSDDSFTGTIEPKTEKEMKEKNTIHDNKPLSSGGPQAGGDVCLPDTAK